MSLDPDRILKSVRKVEKFIKKAPHQPTPEQVHDLRTHARKLESAMHALSLDSNSEVRELLKDLKKVRSRAGKIRDMDVLTGHVCSVKVNGEQDCEIQLLEHLAIRRRKQAKKLHATVLKQSAALKKELEQAGDELKGLFRPTDGRPSEAAAEAMAHAVQLSSELSLPTRLTRSNLHPYRLKVKELRYVLQMADRNGQPGFVKALGEVKDTIGEWHDWEELIAITNDVLDHGPGCGLLRKFKEISEKKYERALTLANQVRKRYIRTSANKKSNHSGFGLSRGVLAATSALGSQASKQAA